MLSSQRAALQESQEPAFLRDQAAKCRRLAGSINDPDVAATLRNMGTDYEAEARGLERQQVDRAPQPNISRPQGS
jgi:hypothetical protein